MGRIAVIMAGGFGTRLRPLTSKVPKPMLDIGGRPLLEKLVCDLRDAGFETIIMSVHYLKDQIQDHFGDGSKYGVRINYLEEKDPLGTAGGLVGLGCCVMEPVLVVNGDLLTSIDFKNLHKFHVEQGSELTVGVRRVDIEVPYGVVRMDGTKVVDIVEKPVRQYLVNTGVYVLSPSALDCIPLGGYQMTDLICNILQHGGLVTGYRVAEEWLDIGSLADYERAKRRIG